MSRAKAIGSKAYLEPIVISYKIWDHSNPNRVSIFQKNIVTIKKVENRTERPKDHSE